MCWNSGEGTRTYSMRPAEWLNRVGLSQVSNDCRITFFSSADRIWSQGLGAEAGEVAIAIVQSLPHRPACAGRFVMLLTGNSHPLRKAIRFPRTYRRLVTCPKLMCPFGIGPRGDL